MLMSNCSIFVTVLSLVISQGGVRTLPGDVLRVVEHSSLKLQAKFDFKNKHVWRYTKNKSCLFLVTAQKDH